MSNKLLSLMLLCLLLFGRPSLAAVCESETHPGITALFVEASTKQEELRSNQWVYSYRELIRKSASFCLVDKEDRALLTVSIIGVNADPEGVSAAMSVVSFFATGGHSYLDHALYVTGRNRLELSAKDALADLDGDLERHKKSGH